MIAAIRDFLTIAVARSRRASPRHGRIAIVPPLPDGPAGRAGIVRRCDPSLSTPRMRQTTR